MRYFNDQKLIFTERRRSTRERPNLYACASVCEILTMMMHQRILKNPGYSLRAYARDLGMSVSTLSGILKGLQNLSLQRAEDIALRLGIKRPGPALQQHHVVDEFDRNPELRRRSPVCVPFPNEINNALTKFHRKWLAHT